MKKGSDTHHGSISGMQHSVPASGMNMAKDPVCWMDVNPEKGAETSVYQGATYYFCSPGRKKAFDQNPTKYVDGSGKMKGPRPMSGG